MRIDSLSVSHDFKIRRNSKPTLGTTSPSQVGSSLLCGSQNLVLSAQATDADSDALSFTWKLNGATSLSLAPLAAAAGSSSVRFSPTCAQTGPLTISVDVSDGYEISTYAWSVGVGDPSIATIVAYSPVQNSITLPSTGSQSFSISATGKNPLAYEWRLDGNIISGAQSSIYNLNVSPSAITFGAFLVEFPLELQTQIFSYSLGHHWMEAFVAPGDVSARSLEIAQRLARVPRAGSNRAFEDLSIALWRLDKDLVSFLKEIDVEVAFSLLYKLPKNLSLSTAQKAFPGTWGRLLDPKFKAVSISDEEVKLHLKKAKEYKAWHKFSLLDAYKQDRDLLKYLSHADPAEERDIYEASAPESFIHSVRPPFYKIFDLDDEALKALVPKVSLDQWALSLFNVDRPSRRKVETHLSEKQRFMLIEKLKAFDQHSPGNEQIGAAREFIGRTYQQLGPSVAPAAEINYEELLSSTQNAA